MAVTIGLGKHQKNDLFSRRMLTTCSVVKKENQICQSLRGLRDLAQTGQYKVFHDPSVSFTSIAEQLFSSSMVHFSRCLEMWYKGASTEKGLPIELQLMADTSGIRNKAWLLDQFGVLHDGQRPYEGAIATLEQLAQTGIRMVIISNSSRRALTTLEKMRKLGFDPSLFDGAITSGELTYQYLLRRDDPWFAALGRRCIHMTWFERGAISLEGLGLQIIEDLEAADFILAHGTEAIGLANGNGVKPMELEKLEQILENAVDKGIPMIVANPDHVTVEARALRAMPGTLGTKYEQLGGEVRWMGKPDQVIYKAAKEMARVDAAECIAVGDSLHHDILGANNSGMQSIFVVGGIHANEVGMNQFGMVPEEAAVEALTHSYGAYPSYIIPSFIW